MHWNVPFEERALALPALKEWGEQNGGLHDRAPEAAGAGPSHASQRTRTQVQPPPHAVRAANLYALPRRSMPAHHTTRATRTETKATRGRNSIHVHTIRMYLTAPKRRGFSMYTSHPSLLTSLSRVPWQSALRPSHCATHATLLTPSSSPPPPPARAPGYYPASSAPLCSRRPAGCRSAARQYIPHIPQRPPEDGRARGGRTGGKCNVPSPCPACSGRWPAAAAAGRPSGAPGPGTGGLGLGRTWFR